MNDHDKIIRLEEQTKVIGANVEKIMNNHLVHVQASLDKLDGRMDKLDLKIATWSGIAMAVGAIFQTIFKFL